MMPDERPPLSSFVKRPPLESFMKDGGGEQQAAPAGMSWSEVGGKALENAVPSAVQFGKDLVQPILHPIDTAQSLYKLGSGVAQKTGLQSGDENIKYADAVGQYFSGRYGGMDNLKKTLSTDPVGFAADLSAVLSGGGSLAARAPGMVGKVGEVARTAGRVVDPLSIVSAPGGKLASEVIGRLGTHTGAEPLRAAYEAGQKGGQAGQTFRENLRGIEPMEETVAEARRALSQLRTERGQAYRSGMAGVSKDKTILSFNDLDAGVNAIANVKNYKGQSLSPSTEKIRNEMVSVIDGWRNLKASEFHTVEGFDALKQKLGDIRDATQFGTPERRVADEIYHSARDTIVKQAPEYAKVMKGYEEATKQIKDIEKTLSLNPNASIDTSLRKLQSALRDNVNTSFGRRKELADFLVRSGAPHLLERLAGQALKPWLPRGLGALLGGQILAAGAGSLGAAAHGVAAGAGAGAGVLAAAPFMSPRAMGEGAHLAGRASNFVPPRGAVSGTYQAGRVADRLDPREMTRQDARAALRNKKEAGFSASQITQMQKVARGTADVDTVLAVKKMLERRTSGEKGDRAPLRVTVNPIMPQPQYGGPQ